MDIKAISQWLRSHNWFGNANLHKIEFGFEITSASGGLDFSCDDYSLSYSSGGGGSSGGSGGSGGCDSSAGGCGN